jgi:hypothetical protein
MFTRGFYRKEAEAQRKNLTAEICLFSGSKSVCSTSMLFPDTSIGRFRPFGFARIGGL